MMQRRRPNPSHPNIQIAIHSQSLLQQIQTELATDVKFHTDHHTQEVTKKYAKHSRQNVVIVKKLVTIIIIIINLFSVSLYMCYE